LFVGINARLVGGEEAVVVGGAVGLRYTSVMASEPHVTLSGDIVGEYVVKKKGAMGELTIVPDEYPATVPKYGGRRATPEEFEAFVAQHDILPPDGEG
jgi:hypothetical protein